MSQFQNIVNQFSFIACFQGVFLALALFFLKKGDPLLNRILGALLAVSSWSGFYYTLDFMGKYYSYPYLSNTNFLTDYSYNPLIYLYVLRLTSKDFKLSKKTILHFIPVFLLFIYYFNYFIAPYSEKVAIMHKGYNFFPYDVETFSYVNLLQFFIYLGLSTFVLQRYGKKIKEYYSDIGKRNYNWIKFILIINMAVAVLCFFLFRTGWAIFGQVLSVLSALLIYAIGYKMISAPPHLPDIELKAVAEPEQESIASTEITTSPKYVRSGLSDDRSKQIASKLSQLMNEQKPYLDPELNLKQLSDQLHIQQHHLSQALNQQFGKNFYDYINDFRVKEVISRIKDPRYNHLTLLAIGLESGFNSKASFNSVFKKFTGRSPSDYKKQEYEQIIPG